MRWRRWTVRVIAERAGRSSVALPLCVSLAFHGAIAMAWWQIDGLGVGRGAAGTSVGGGANVAFSAVVMLDEKLNATPPDQTRAAARPKAISAPPLQTREVNAKRVETANANANANGDAASGTSGTAGASGATPSPARESASTGGQGSATESVTTSSGAGPRGEGGLTFAGLSADAALASSVVYVVDASAPMVSTLPWVVGEVERSVAGLLPTQRFNVVLFSERGQDSAAGASGAARAFSPGLVDATSRQRAKLADYLRGQEAAGRSTPIAGLREAMKMKPRVVFVLARSIARTQGAQWDQGNDAILSELETLNPIDPATGRRATVIKVIQFLDADPTGLLPRIAAMHGEPVGAGAVAGGAANGRTTTEAKNATARGETVNLRTVTRAEIAGAEAGAGRVNLGVR